MKTCPFCGNQPAFEGNAGVWQDDSRYVELSLVCCVRMTESLGWRKARQMTVEERTKVLKELLIARWDTREQEAQPWHANYSLTPEQIAEAEAMHAKLRASPVAQPAAQEPIRQGDRQLREALQTITGPNNDVNPLKNDPR